jgi:hypothetical protein
MMKSKPSKHDLNSAVSRLELFLRMVERNSLPEGENRPAIMKSAMDAFFVVKEFYITESQTQISQEEQK